MLAVVIAAAVGVGVNVNVGVITVACVGDIGKKWTRRCCCY